MHITRIVQRSLSKVMHQKRLLTLSVLLSGVFNCRYLSLTRLGRDLDCGIQARSGVRKVDRFLGNKQLHAERKGIYGVIWNVHEITLTFHGHRRNCII